MSLAIAVGKYKQETEARKHYYKLLLTYNTLNELGRVNNKRPKAKNKQV
jgi:hypothetical protein